MARLKPEIAPWKWIEKTKPEDVTFEEIVLAYRLKGPGITRCPFRCLRNCRKNPYCIWGLGEKAWILSGAEDNADEDNNPEFRKEDDFAGIINLGTTCYVNALLQLWFHNPIIRPAILSWKAPYAEDTDKFQPLCPLGQLQAMFARMKLSKRSAIDPTMLIESLGLNIAEQQDAQEFAKLFMSMLSQMATEDALQGELDRAFEGTSKYEMECKECRQKHSREETFTELDLCVKDAKDTSASFAKLFMEEELTGDNQYLCQNCSKKTDAIRRFSIVKLPPVLNIQLLRFIYDKDTRRKKKVTTPYAFPEFLDMSSFVESTDPSSPELKYQLTGYLVHNGKSTSSGHYVAHIRDIRTGAWHIFNDDSVSEQKAAKSSKNINEEETTLKSEKTGEYKSTGAYMLVYTHQSLIQDPKPDPEVPGYLKQLVADEDATFESEIQTSKKERELKALYLEERKSTVEALYSLLVPEKETPTPTSDQNSEVPQINGGSASKVPENNNKNPPLSASKRYRLKENGTDIKRNGKEKNVKDSKQVEQQLAYEKAKEYQDRYSIGAMEFLPYTWLTSWLNQSTEPVPPIDTKLIRCPHKKLILPSGNVSVPYKAIPTEIADILYEKYGGEDRLTGKGALCRECVIAECRHQRGLMDLENDSKRVQELMTKTQKSIEAYLKNREGVDYSEEFWLDKVWVSKNSLRKWKGWARGRLFPENPDKDVEIVENSQDLAPQNFNDDIKCQHDGLTVDDGARRLASVEAWSIIQKYFPECFEARASTSSPCSECLNEKTKSRDIAAENRKFAEKLKDRIPDLLRNKNRPRGTKSGHYYFVDVDFIRGLSSFVRNPERYDDHPVVGDTAQLLCDHKKFKFPIQLVEKLKNDLREFASSPDAERMEQTWCLVKEEEWTFLKEAFAFEHEIEVYVEEGNYLYIPDVCEPCSQEWYDLSYAELCHFENEPIYLKPVDSDEVEVLADPVQQQDDDADEDFQVMQPQSKKKRTAANSTDLNAEVRRSGRSRHGKKEKRVFASSTDTVKLLRFSLVRELGYKILASDITLYYKDKALTDESATLSSLGIFPNSRLEYRTEVRDENDDSMEVDSCREPETGFAGTMLQLRLDDRRLAQRTLSSSESQADDS